MTQLSRNAPRLALMPAPLLSPVAMAAEAPSCILTSFINGDAKSMSVYRSTDAVNFTLEKAEAFKPPQGLLRDPSIIRHKDGWYYVADTTDWNNDLTGFARSKDLRGWTFLGNHNISMTDDVFSFKAPLPDGEYTIPQAGTLRLRGHDATLWLAGYTLERQRLVYSTSELFTHLRQGDGDLALFHGRQAEDGETVLRYSSAPTVTVLDGKVDSGFDAAKGDLRQNYGHQGLARVRISGGGRPHLTLLIADLSTAETFWRQETKDGVLQQRGPTLVRAAEVRESAL